MKTLLLLAGGLAIGTLLSAAPAAADPEPLPPDEPGTVEYLVGDLGDLPETTLDYSTFSAAGWTIVGEEAGTRFTNDRTGHGMFVSIDEVSTY